MSNPFSRSTFQDDPSDHLISNVLKQVKEDEDKLRDSNIIDFKPKGFRRPSIFDFMPAED